MEFPAPVNHTEILAAVYLITQFFVFFFLWDVKSPEPSPNSIEAKVVLAISPLTLRCLYKTTL